MKLRKILLFILFGMMTVAASAQPHLRISSLSRFPVAPNDTAYEASVYDSITIQIENIGNTAILDQYDVFMSAHPADRDTLYNYTDTFNTVIQGGMTFVVVTNNFRFSPSHYDDGDNIIVVWPAARNTPNVTSDTLTFHIYFYSLTHSIPEEGLNPITFYPNPATDYILLQIPDKNTLKQVRIYDLSGRLLFDLPEGNSYIPISNWAKGMYLLEMVGVRGERLVRKIVVE
jgi:hypothetical protein